MALALAGLYASTGVGSTEAPARRTLVEQAAGTNATQDEVIPNSILAAICVSSTKRSMYTSWQLHSFVELCNKGYNIKVVLHTQDNTWNNTVLFQPGALWCHRLMRDLDVEVRVFPQNLGVRLCSHHRHTISEFKDRFEWFLYTEDDLDVRAQHVVNLMEQHRILNGTRYMPGLRRIEVNSSYMDTYPDQLRIYFSDGCTGSVARIRGRLYYKPGNAYWASWFLPRGMLKAYIEHDDNWLDDIDTKHDSNGHREHFAHFWLLHKGLSVVLPIDSIHEYLINHLPNNYISDYEHWQTPDKWWRSCYVHQFIERLGLSTTVGATRPFTRSPDIGVDWQACLTKDNTYAELPTSNLVIEPSTLCRVRELPDARVNMTQAAGVHRSGGL